METESGEMEPEMDSEFEEDADLEVDGMGNGLEKDDLPTLAGFEAPKIPEFGSPLKKGPAFGSALKKPDAEFGSALKKPDADFGSALKKADPAFGSALKKPQTGFGSALKSSGTSTSLGLKASLAQLAPPPPPHPSLPDLTPEELERLEHRAQKKREARKRQKEARRAARAAQGLSDSDSDSDPYEAPSKPPTNLPNPTNKPSDPHAVTPANLETRRFIQPIPRPAHLVESRSELPIMQYESKILDAVLHNPVTIICGSTGSGKTTQVPQMLYEFGFGNPEHPLFSGNVVVTEPRRVAAVGVAKRVTEEMGDAGKMVGWQVRYDKSEGLKDAKVRFVTDGILLRELSAAAQGEGGDLLLEKYSCIVLDEAHERTVGTDILIGWLSRIVKLRNSEKARRSGVKPLRLVIMSATLRVADFADNKALWDARPPVINVEGRQFKVTVHFQKRTPVGPGAYVKEAFRKLCKIHERLPPGGVLVFLTGKGEIEALVRMLRKKYPKRRGIERERESLEEQGGEKDAEGNGEGFVVQDDAELENEGEDDLEKELEAELGRADAEEDEDDEDGEGYESEEEEVQVLAGEDDGEENDGDPTLREKLRTPSSTPREEIAPLHILPLHSMLPTSAQMRIFKETPSGHRLVVIATNIAETSLTIPGIRYVLDAGKVKSRDYDPRTGVQRFVTGWTSRASADQRAGRAGRVGPGHCYRLFSSAVFGDQFEEWTEPEISRVPLEGVILQMKSMGIAQVGNFPYPTAPDGERLRSAEKLLTYLRAIDPASVHLMATTLGSIMGKLPVSPRYAKMIVLAAQQSPEGNVLAHVIALVAGLSVPGEVFVRPSDVLEGKNAPGATVDDEDDDGDEIQSEATKEQRKARHGKYWRAMAMFAGPDPTSDHLRVLGAIGAYEHHRHGHPSESALERFCREHFLNPKSMAEISKLRHQLMTLAKAVLAPYAAESATVQENLRALMTDPRMPPPNTKQRGIIGQLLFAGFPDQLAMLRPASEAVGKPGSRKANYATLETPLDHPVHIHSASCLATMRPAPAWLVYTEIVGRDEVMDVDGQTVLDVRGGLKNPTGPEARLMKICTVVKEPWLTALAPPQLCSFTEILDDPPPEYDAEKDQVFCLAKAVYAGKWPVGGTMRVAFPLGPTAPSSGGIVNKIRWFARFLLEGAVFSKPRSKKASRGGGDVDPFAILSPYLLQPARTVATETAKHLKRVADLLKALTSRRIDSRRALLNVWRSEPTFLKTEFSSWLPEQLQSVVSKKWPPIKVVDKGSQDYRVDGEFLQAVEAVLGAPGAKSKGKQGSARSSWAVTDYAGRRGDSSDDD